MRQKDCPLVTIGIPTYNRANGYLREALESALAQTYPNLEIIVSDNCSTDDTSALVNSYANSRVRYVRQQVPLTPNENFNFCLQQARGVYFLLLHDDDLIDPDFVDICMRKANYDIDIGVIRTGARIINAHGNVLREKRNADSGLSTVDLFIAWFENKSWWFLCSTLFNTKILREAGGFGSRHQLFQDVLAEVQLAVRFGRVDVPEIRASFRRHPTQRTGVVALEEWCEDSLMLLDTMCSLVPKERDVVRTKGLEHFARHNYEIARGIRSPIRRYLGYLAVYRRFERQYPPWRFFYSTTKRKVFSRLGKVKRRIKKLVKITP